MNGLASTRRLSVLTVLSFLLVIPVHAGKPLLRYEIRGLEPEAKQNVEIHLGQAPDSEDERANLIYSARGDVERALNALGYYSPDIELDLLREEPIWSLLIDVDPGPRVQVTDIDVQVSGEAGDDEAFQALLRESPLLPGRGLNHGDYEAFKSRLLSLGSSRGYFDEVLGEHRIEVDAERAEASITLHYDSGDRYKFGAIHYDDFPLRQRRLEQLQPFAPGDPFDLASLQALQANLQRSGYFGNALAYPMRPDPATRTVPVAVKLEPGDRNHYRVGLGYSTDTDERVSLTWRTPLINSRGHSQETRLEYSPVRPRANFTYVIPLSHPLDDQLRLGARLESNEFGSLDSWQREAAAYRDWKAADWKGGDWIAGIGARYLREDWTLGPEDLENEYFLPGVSIAHTVREGNALDPEAGFSQLYTLELGVDQLASDLDMQRLYANWRVVFSPAPRHRLVGRAELGAVFFPEKSRPDLAPSLSFFAGGAHSIRGYAYQSLGPSEKLELPDGREIKLVVGGNRLALASAEYQYYLTPEWRAALFVDGGNAFDDSDFDPVVGAGIGVHYVSPVGAVRVDFANGVSENESWRVHLTLGAEF